ncbi:MAG: carboxylating nicotinate-nucleotide diphosphorylase [Deltaproteobacteria bacterium]|nr:MAG: carboxylating nicotinate-nucleotide diphosphorylase [Deltaproteobacteria bacterium]
MLPAELESLIRRALAEDVGSGDITTLCTVPSSAVGKGRIVARESLILAGIAVAKQVFWTANSLLEVASSLQDGDLAKPGQSLLEVTGSLAAILMAERTALNFLQRLSGIATLTRTYVDKLSGTRTRILDTRKTTPVWRFLEKEAVRAGGGYNHRFGLYDGVLIKDNHIIAAGGIQQAVLAARTCKPHTLMVEVEVETLDQLDEALAAGIDAVLLDNMNLETIAEAVKRVDGQVLVEASGGITLDNIGEVAATGVDLISVGALTHSARAVDISMEIETA